MSNLFSYDTETTGLPEWKIPSDDPAQPHIVQLAATLVHPETRKVIQSMDVIIKPDGWVISPETIEVHGITTEHAMDVGIPEKLALEMFLAMRGDAERIAYNKTFDQRIIRIACKRYLDEAVMEKWAVKDDHHCSMRMAQSLLGGRSPKLINAYKELTGKTLVGAHSAMADTNASTEVYFAVLGKEAEAA
ncbi:MAG: 3'-5' exonuclease [Cycloclasticus sp.]